MAANISVKVLAPIRLRWALSLENAILMGLRSGLYGGRKSNQHLLDVSREGGTFHRALDDPGRNHRIGGEARDKGLCAP